MNWFVQVLNNLEAWFVNIRIRINSPTYIINMASAIESLPEGDTKKYLKGEVRFSNLTSGKNMEENFKKFLKQEGL